MGQKTVGFFQILFIFHLITHSGLCFLSSQYRIANSRPVKSNYHDHHFNIYASPLNENFNDVQSLNNTLSDTKSSLVGTNITLVVNSNEEEEEEDLDNEFYMPGLFGTSESKSIYPYSMSSQKVERHLPSDFSFKDLKVDDPLFLDMPWPTEASEESSAFARHFQWKRKLSDGERLRWQKWAIYQRLMIKNNFQYSIEDYIFQNLLRDLENKNYNDNKSKNNLWGVVKNAFKEEQKQEVLSVMKAYYTAFNNKNFDNLKLLWLPDENVEILLPGYDKVIGHLEVSKLYRRLLTRDIKYFGSVKSEIVSVQSYGFVVVVKTIETIEAGTYLKIANKRKGQSVLDIPTKTQSQKRVFATTILRKFNKQWRIMQHTASRFSTSGYTNDLADVKFNQKLKTIYKINNNNNNNKEKELLSASQGVNKISLIEEVTSLLKNGIGSLTSVNRMKADGTWEKVISMDDNNNKIKSKNNPSENTRKPQKLDYSIASMSEEENIKNILKSKRININSDGLYSDENEIDNSLSVSKQTIQAIRKLEKSKRLSTNDKNILIQDIVESISNTKSSLVEISYELIRLMENPNVDGVENNEPIKQRESFEDFAEQCKIIIKNLKTKKEENDDEEEEDE